MQVLVEEGGFQRPHYLEQLDQLFELQKQLTDISEQKDRVNLENQKITPNLKIYRSNARQRTS